MKSAAPSPCGAAPATPQQLSFAMRRHSPPASALAAVTLALALLALPAGAHGRSVPLPPGAQAEAVAHAARSLFVVADARSAAVLLVDAASRLLATVVPPSPDRAALGLSLRAGRLFVAGGGRPGQPARMFVYRLSSGALLAACDAPSGAFVNDVVADRRFAYFTDSFLGNVYALDVAALPQCRFSTIALPRDKFPPAPFVFAANGIVRFASGLIIANTNRRALFYTDLRSNQTQQLLPDGSLPGADGLDIVYHNKRQTAATLFVAQNSQNLVSVWRVSLRASPPVALRFVRNITSDSFDTPTAVAVGGGTMVVANARFGAAPLSRPLPPGTTFALSVFRLWAPFARFWFLW